MPDARGTDPSSDPRQQGQKPTRPDRASAASSPLALAGLGAQFFAAILFFVYAGSWLDDRFGTSPLCLLVGLFVGGGGTFYLAYRRLAPPGGDAR